MRKSIIALLVVFLLLFSGCKHTTDGNVPAPDGILADKKDYRTYRKDGEIWLEFKENYIQSKPLGLIDVGITFRSASEMVLAFETGSLSSGELLKVDLSDIPSDGNLNRAVKVVPMTLYEPILPESIEFSECQFYWKGGDSYTYNFGGKSTLYVSFSDKDEWTSYLDRNKEKIDYKITDGSRELSVDSDRDLKTTHIYVKDKSPECYYVVQASAVLSEDEIIQFDAEPLERTSRTEFYQMARTRYIAESSQMIAKTVFYSSCSILLLCLILFLILLLLRRRKKGKVVSEPPAPPASDAEDPPIDSQ